MVTLRPYQEKCIADLSNAIFRDKFKSPLLVAPTGAGKTRMFAYLISRLTQKNLRCVALCHREELLTQISLALQDVRVQHGLIAANCHYDRGLLAHVASVFTLVRRMDKVAVPDFVIIDEAHHCVSGTTWGKVIGQWREMNPNLVVIGVTATPERLSGEGLGEVFDTMVLGPTTGELIRSGWLSPYRLIAPQSSVDVASLKRRGGDIARDVAAAAVDKPTITGNAVAEYRKYCDGAPAVVFCVSIAHAEHVAETFKSAGYRAISIDGKMDKTERRDVIRDFGAGKYNILTSCDLISEGFDCPGIVAGILLRPTDSLAMFLQQVGRTLRIANGKDTAWLIDLVGNWANHGLPDDEREWTLDAKARSKRGKKDPDDVSVKNCQNCYTVIKAVIPKCPYCGHVFPVKARKIEEVEGDLVEVDVEAMRIAREMNLRAQGQAQTIDDFVTQLGFSPGRANHVLEARAEKDRLRGVLAEALADCHRATGRWLMSRNAIKAMKPKELKAMYARCQEEIHMAALAEIEEAVL
jgi:DNA repair protein RadD